jgi:sialate O-acetylesterase
VGEVWIGSGQSNMDMPVNKYRNGDPVLATNAATAYPHLRIIRSGWKGWEASTPDSNARFSALLFSFGVPLQKELNVPVGLMVGAVGGTPSGFWLTEDMYRSDPACKAAAAKFAETFSMEAQRQYTNALAQWELAAASAGTNPPARPVLAPTPPESTGKIGHLFEAHIRNYVPFAIRGVLWDQGESGTAIRGVDQYAVMGALIRGWRQLWGQGDFPFIYVQKPSGGGAAWDPSDPVTRLAEPFGALPPAPPADGRDRELHIRIMQYPRTAMAISSDLGPGIHPACKSGYGARAARVALGLAYGRPVEYYGPVYQSHAVEGGTIRIRFTHVGQGLAFRGGDKLQGFAVAGADRKFHWADAVIDGDTVVASSDKVPAPVAIRYAWSQKHRWANLFNKDGLPALPFRTDTQSTSTDSD